MENNKTFTITFTKQNGESTTRKAKWTDKCQEFVANAGHKCLTFLDLEATERYGKEWNDKYQLDLIGRDYCRDRSIACTEQEYMMLINWKNQKSQFVMAHHKWIKSILDQMKEIKLGLKGYKYLDEAIELCTELGMEITEAEIIRTNSTGLTIYNPKNLADRIKGMKNKREKTREEKIAERMAYMKAQNSVN